MINHQNPLSTLKKDFFQLFKASKDMIYDSVAITWMTVGKMIGRGEKKVQKAIDESRHKGEEKMRKYIPEVEKKNESRRKVRRIHSVPHSVSHASSIS